MLDTAKNKRNLEKVYQKISKHKLTKEEKEVIRDYTTSVVANIFTKEELEKIISDYKEYGGENMLVETLKREMKKDREKAKRLGREEGIREGIKEGEKEGRIIGLKSVAKEMLKEDVDVQKIRHWTKLTEKEINELKKEI